MEFTLLDLNLIAIDTLDTFNSLIWKDKYCGFGDFEVTIPAGSAIAGQLHGNLYLRFKDSEHLMIIEYINIHTDAENGDTIIVKGRSLESILDRRVIKDKIVLTGNLQAAIWELINENAIYPVNTNREISLLEFEETDDTAITGLTVDAQFDANTDLYTAITDLCLSNGIGYKIILTNEGKFQFKLYAGADRSYDQILNPYVTFSPDFENSINGDYTESNMFLKTVTYVAGEKGVANERLLVEVDIPGGEPSDLDRREMFTDAGDVTRNAGDTTLTEEEYLAKLQQKGLEDLAKNTLTKAFEGEADTTYMYVYGEDFFMGDIVQVADDYGNEARSRVTEFIYSQDINGIKTYPTFSAVI